MLADHANAIQRVCFDAEPSEADLEVLGSRERWLIYRDLVRTRLLGVIEAALPRTKSAIGSDPFGRAFDEWLGAGGPKTRFFRHVPNELGSFAIPIWEDVEAPWIADLARYEISAWTVRHAPPNPTPGAEFSFDARPVVATAVRVLRLEHPVHQVPPPEAGYPSKPTILCVHRSAEHRAINQELNPLAADLLEAWQRADETVSESVHRVAETHGTEIGPAFIEKLSTLITNFIQHGILLGGHSPPR